MPKSGAGRGFRCKIREEALRKKYGIVLKESQPKDQPWLLQVEGQLGWKFKGIKRGGVIEHTSYYIFTQCPDGAFEAFQVHNWYNFMPLSKGCTLTAWEEWERRNPVPNHLSITQQWWWKDQEEDDKEKEKPGCKKADELCICDLEDDLEMSSNDSKASGEEGGWGPKVKKKVPSSKGGQKKKKKGSDDEAFEVRDNGDFKGQEVDYMSASRSNSQEELEGKPKVTQQGESPKGMDKQSMSCDERQEDKKAPMLQEKKQRKHSCEESDINRETSLVCFMVKKMPPKR
ncbi:hypothetical protein JEQ12_001531 [Ovis aries]|uniref:Transcription initiation factor IIF subunit alpha n=2 Tax=Ovis TaxID=9935 RepID=A0A836AQ85_SHEEP|nr:hypothetical protein JEQ12_001531 [Ovis aries]